MARPRSAGRREKARIAYVVPVVIGLLIVEAAVVTLVLKNYAERKDILQTIATFWGGTVIAAGLYLTAQTIQVNNEGQVTGRYTEAIKQLAHEDIAVRIGGIYALERIANDSEKDFRTVMEVLALYIRQVVPRPSDKGEVMRDTDGYLRADIQAALTVIGRRNPPSSAKDIVIDLSDTDLRKARLLGLNFDSVIFERALLSGTDMRDTSLVGANFSQAIMSRVRIHPSHFRDDKVYHRPDLRKATFQFAQLDGALLFEIDARGAYFGGAHLDGADFHDADLRGATIAKMQLDSMRANDGVILPLEMR